VESSFTFDNQLSIEKQQPSQHLSRSFLEFESGKALQKTLPTGTIENSSFSIFKKTSVELSTSTVDRSVDEG